MDFRQQGRALQVLVLSLLALACIYLLYELRDVVMDIWMIVSAVLTPFLISVIIAYLLHPLVTRLHQRGVPRGASILIIYVLFFLLLTVLLLKAIPLFIDQLRDLSEHLPKLVEQADRWMDSFNEDKKRLPDAVRKAVDENLGNLEGRVTALITKTLESAGHTIEGAISWFVIPFLVFYMLKDLKLIERAVVTFFPRRNRQAIIRLSRSIDEALGNYIRGQLLIAMVVGGMAYVGYLIVGMPYAIILSLIVAITNIIPYIGPFFGAAPAILLAFTVSPLMALKVLIVNLIIQQLEGNLVGPYLIGRSLKLHPMLIIFALLLGGEVFGIVGLILAIPLVAVGKVIVQHVVLHYMKH
ncbi:AI-2E family transporter [Tumebacillus lipolyticus]|uniref:AI-2E family transporter n=1 Tax=Tumebacillus lipolyticus TaxID=1280370 RepID=A0ABW4ZVI5_9BACL